MQKYASTDSTKVHAIRPIEQYGPNEVWPFAVQFHEAKKAGPHFDLRLVDPMTGYGHSWAVPKATWPKPGEKAFAVRTPTHSRDYSLRQGEWELSGYGSGKVKNIRLEPAEVVKADEKQVKFNLYGPGQKVEELSIIQVGKDNALLVNHTPSKELKAFGDVPSTKPKYRSALIDDVHTDREGQVIQPKLDGAHVVVGLQSGKPTRVFSYRRSKDGDLIEHTHRFKNWHLHVPPNDLKDTLLRAEVWATTKEGPLPASQLAGLLNTDVWTARAKAPDLKLTAFDIIKYKGEDYNDAPYSKKYNTLKEIQKAAPWIDLVETAERTRDKKKLLQDIRTKQHPDTDEGVVVWNKNESTPTKAKNKMEVDGTIVGILPGSGRLSSSVGSLQVQEKKDGPVTNVGSGLSDKIRKRIAENPDKFVGLKARIQAQGRHSSGRLRAPVFKDLHFDKNDPDALVEAIEKTSSAQMKDLIPLLIGAGATVGMQQLAVRYLKNSQKKHGDFELSDPQVKQLKKVMEISPKIVQKAELKPLEAFAFPDPSMARMAGLPTSKKDGTIVLSKKSPSWVTAHELGHIQSRKRVGRRFYDALNYLHTGANIGGLTAFAAGMMKNHPKVAGTGAAVQAAAQVGLLGEELSASLRGYEGLKAIGASDKELKAARRNMGAAYATYLSALPMLAGMGATVARLAKKVK